jgi:hypothetical protein
MLVALRTTPTAFTGYPEQVRSNYALSYKLSSQMSSETLIWRKPGPVAGVTPETRGIHCWAGAD